jgi:hypothetical protein
MTDLEKALRGSIAIAALPKLVVACEKLYRLANEEFNSLSAAALVSRETHVYSSARASADIYLEALLEAEKALAIANPVVEILRKAPEVAGLPRRIK